MREKWFVKKIKFVCTENNFEKKNLRSLLSTAISDQDYDFVIFSNKKNYLLPQVTWDELLDKALPENIFCGVILGSPAGKALTYPPKFPMFESGFVGFASAKLRSSEEYKHFQNFNYYLHFSSWASIEFELYHFVDFLFFKKRIHVFEDEKNLVNEYGEFAPMALNRLHFYPRLGLICLSDLKCEAVAKSLLRGNPQFEKRNHFLNAILMLKKLILRNKKNNEFIKNYNL